MVFALRFLGLQLCCLCNRICCVYIVLALAKHRQRSGGGRPHIGEVGRGVRFTLSAPSAIISGVIWTYKLEGLYDQRIPCARLCSKLAKLYYTTEIWFWEATGFALIILSKFRYKPISWNTLEIRGMYTLPYHATTDGSYCQLEQFCLNVKPSLPPNNPALFSAIYKLLNIDCQL